MGYLDELDFFYFAGFDSLWLIQALLKRFLHAFFDAVADKCYLFESNLSSGCRGLSSLDHSKPLVTLTDQHIATFFSQLC